MKKLLFNPQTMRKLTKAEQKNIKGGIEIGIDCDCVPYYQCDVELTDPNIPLPVCPGSLEVCCFNIIRDGSDLIEV